MKKLGVWSIVKWFAPICAMIVVFPFVINFVIEFISTCFKFEIDWRIEWHEWCDFIAVALPSALTYAVIQQSERHEKDNTKTQEKLETINRKMLVMEQQSKMGYFIPYIKLKDAGVEGFDRHTIITSSINILLW